MSMFCFMNDPLVFLSISLEANKGAYAVLVGSGVSRGAGIPTGWEITCDLIRRVAVTQNQEVGEDPAGWYRCRFCKEPDYSELLEALASTEPERQRLLMRYFEPTPEERERGLKVPSSAHRALAKLVSSGYVRVVLTTNFDRLLEHALQDAGIEPTVVSTEDQVKGLPPLASAPPEALVCKLHGDYRDSRIRNTATELAAYPEAVSQLLDRILDEFGLIVCGWSAKWDVALRSAIERRSTRRFATFWACKGEPEEEARRLIEHCQAVRIEIRDANHFFEDVLAKVRALEQLGSNHPVIAKEEVKLYLSEYRYRIRLHDLVTREVEETKKRIRERIHSAETFPTNAFDPEEYQRQLTLYESMCEPVVSMLAALAYHDPGGYTKLLVKAVERMSTISFPGGPFCAAYQKLAFLPGLFCLYAAGITARANNRWKHLAGFLLHARCLDPVTGKKEPLISAMTPRAVFAGMETNLCNLLGEARGQPCSGKADLLAVPSEYLFERLQPKLAEYLPEPSEYEEVFDLFEHLVSFVWLDLNSQPHQAGQKGSREVPFGRYIRRIASSPSVEASPLFQATEVVPPSALRFGFFLRGSRHFHDITHLKNIWLDHRNRAWQAAGRS